MTSSEKKMSSTRSETSPITNLIAVQSRLDSLSRFLSESIKLNAPINDPAIADFASYEIAASVNQIVLSGKAILSAALTPPILGSNLASTEQKAHEIVDLDAEELLADRVHVCEICGKGFRRDSNLRMHMRAHGDRFKCAEALVRPAGSDRSGVRFSCPSPGCNRNKAHRNFRPLKSALCARNHFKRSHCPKLYTCNRCQNRSFSLLSDLRSHLRTCLVAAKWRCSCGLTFSAKDKLFGHVALLEGHVPQEVELADGGSAIEDDGEEEEEEDDDDDDEVFEGLLSGFASVDEPFSLQDVLGL